MACQHLDFEATVAVSVLTDGPDGPITSYAADIMVRCRQCELPFHFLGDLPIGSRNAQPTTSPDRLELRCPLAPGPGIVLTPDGRAPVTHAAYYEL